MNTPTISIVIPVCNERDSLGPLIGEIDRAMAAASIAYEIIAVDDGSTDGSAAALKKLAVERDDFTAVLFRRNFGQSAAFDAGFRQARGKYIATLDADGQNDPDDIPRLFKMLSDNELEFVSGVRAQREDGWVLRKLPSLIANRMIRLITGTKIRDLGCSIKLYDRRVIEHVYLYGEMHRFLSVIIEGNGGRTGQMNVNHRPRTCGKSKYGLARTFKVMLDLATVWFLRGFSTKPIYVFGGAALALLAGSIACCAFVLYRRLIDGVYVHLQPLFIVGMVMALAALQLAMIGLLAEVLIRTYFESRGRPPYDIRETVSRPARHTPQLEISVSERLGEVVTRRGNLPLTPSA